MIISVALAALVALPNLSAIEAIPRHADLAVFAVAFVGLLVGRRFSGRGRVTSGQIANRKRDDA